MTAFNLTREPWIPVETLDSAVVELSTRDALKQAHALRSLADSSPLVVAALTRHLLAVLHRAYDGPRTMDAWCEIASSGAFDAGRVDAYLDRVEDRMDLFHPTHPFAQTKGLRERFGEYTSPIDELEVLRSGWGSARELFRHRPEEPRPNMPPGRAARALLAHQAFATGGLIRKPGEPTSATAAPLVRGGLVIIRGQTLFATLSANLLVYDPEHGRPIPTGGQEDRCSWEQDAPPRALRPGKEPKRTPLGYLDVLTWLSRRVEFVHDDEVVTGFINAAYHGMADGASRDPMMTYRLDEKRGFVPIGVDVDRAFWRDAGALFETARADSKAFERPQAIDLVADSKAIDLVGPDTLYDIEVLGIAGYQSRVDAVRVERVQTRAACLNDPDAGGAVRESLDLCSRLIKGLRGSLWSYARAALAPGEREPDKKDVAHFVDSLGAEPAAWSALGVLFESFLKNLGDDPEEAAATFRHDAICAARHMFHGATAQAGSTGRWLKARTLAEASFHRSIASLAAQNSTNAAEGASHG
jgi:CRISPR system Cascade subunit CasA